MGFNESGPYCVASFLTDNQNCGSCGHACGTSETCTNGYCYPVITCPTGYDLCVNSTGPSCTNLQTDGKNCGSCGRACGTSETCTNGVCTFTCPAGQAICVNGAGPYCATLQIDDQNCGFCGRVCGTNETCTSGTCLPACAPGTTMCGGPAGFACTDTQTDALNCGNCGRACGSGEICTTGYCHPACNAGESLCVGALGPVCSTLQTDGQNCGACGNVCRTDEVCTAGACELACPPGTSCTLGGPASLVTDIDAAVVPVPLGRAPTGFVRAGAFAYFSAEDAENGVELWRTDGTAAGTALVRDINPGQAWSSATGLTAVGGDRKSTRLNSSHVKISYAGFCLKKKICWCLGVEAARHAIAFGGSGAENLGPESAVDAVCDLFDLRPGASVTVSQRFFFE